MNLPPEIKSAENFCADLANKHLKIRPVIWPSDYLELVRQRDIAIWNAAIEKAAEATKEVAHKNCVCEYCTGNYNARQAILNLKQKE